MKRSAQSKVASLYQFWSGQQQNQSQERRQLQQRRLTSESPCSPVEVITLTESPLQHVNEVAVTSTSNYDAVKENIPSWTPLTRHSTTSGPSTPTAAYFPSPVHQFSTASEVELEKAGFDQHEGRELRYPVNEFLRQYEIDIVKSCIAANSTVSLPLGVSAYHICAVVIANFLRFFPRSRAIFCCTSLEDAKVFHERAVAVGIANGEVTIVDTFQTFKKTSIHKHGRVIATTPQTLEKIVESDSAVVEDIRCVAFCLGASENQRITKYKKIVGTLTVKGILFRIMVITPSVPSRSRKLGPLRKRQQLITSLFISQWIEPPASDPSFRNNSVPMGISVEYIRNVEVLTETYSMTEKWIERSVIFLEKLNSLIPLPSTKPDHLFTLDWREIVSKANNSTNETVQLIINCMFLVEAARNLIINGPRVLLLYCYDMFGKAEKDSRAGQIQLMILGDTVLSKIYDRLQAKYGYNAESVFDISFHGLSMNSHPKFLRLNKALEKLPSPLKCLILCENAFVSRVVCEALSAQRSRNATIRVLQHQEPPFPFQKSHRSPRQCTGLFSQPRDIVLILGMDIAEAENIADTACSNGLQLVVSMDRRSVILLEDYVGQHVAVLHESYEKLRPTDGQVLGTSDKLSCRRNSLFGSGMIGAVDRYDFNFESSRLQLLSSKMQLVQYLPQELSTIDDNGTHDCPQRHGFELTSAEFRDFRDRLLEVPVVELGFYLKKYGLALLRQQYETVEVQPFHELCGDVPRSILSERLMEFSNGMENIKKKRKTLFAYTDEFVEKKITKFYDSLIENLILFKKDGGWPWVHNEGCIVLRELRDKQFREDSVLTSCCAMFVGNRCSGISRHPVGFPVLHEVNAEG